MKRIIDRIDLVLFQDDAIGEWGVSHKETYNNRGDGFNAFWNGIGIFHDVWEHQHEFRHKYFREDYAMNIGGEMAAMGKMWYYQDTLGLGSYRMLNPHSMHSPGDIMRKSTSDMIEESIKYGYTNFGGTLESSIPYQRPTENGELEYQIEQFWEDVQSWRYEDEYEQEEEDSKQYKQSVSFRKVADLHRWGYKEAEKLVPNNWNNRNTLREFIEFWDKFTKNNNAEELAQTYRELQFIIYKEGEEVSWKAKLKGMYGVKDYVVDSCYEVYAEEEVLY